MALRDTQDVLILEVPVAAFGASGGLRDTQDALILEYNQASHLRVTQDVSIYEYPFINAMFVYQPFGSATLVGFTPEYEPVRKQPLYMWGIEVDRQDSIAADGAKRSATQFSYRSYHAQFRRYPA